MEVAQRTVLGVSHRTPDPCARPLLLTWLFLTLACESALDDIALPGGVSFMEEDSAGVLVATTLGSRARSPVCWGLAPVPETQVGARVGEEPYLF
ncbi:MAG: hypothetical protein F4187_06060 [Gemmatimonadetes bacterium]|nr:hypothetical protein [Gemmatimonadota bacterium]